MKDLRVGIDIGSTTAKIIVTDPGGSILYGDYRRHNTEVFKTLLLMLDEVGEQLAFDEHDSLAILFTGTAGMGVAERARLPFVQEVSASAAVVKRYLPEVRTFIDLGGEDAKIIFFDRDLRPDIRMNGNCAGGTGAFIDQMAGLLGIPVEKLSEEAAKHESCYPIASRCGVFAKTDIQNLLSRDVPPRDIAASIYRAVAYQIISALARGMEIVPGVLFAGGPFHFQPFPRQTFLEIVNLDPEDVVESTSADPRLTAERIPAAGAALRAGEEGRVITYAELRRLLVESQGQRISTIRALPPLFTSEAEYQTWATRKSEAVIPTVGLHEVAERPLFLGVDSGSTTTKIVLIDEDGRLAFTYYAPNKGNPVEAVLTGVRVLQAQAEEHGLELRISRSGVTGYGEDLIAFAFGMDEGHVETIAHYRGARTFEPNVSFILDIGGQDMKAIFVKDGVINNIELNESCSSGSGSFIQTFATTLGLGIEEFAQEACRAQHPCDLGSRCTVFMNSKVKQVLREGGAISDISAGLAYSVIKNCLNKVLKITDSDLLGSMIVVQGGTFRNPAILRAMELVTGRSVIRPDRSELMGAWGAALMARDTYFKHPERIASTFLPWDRLDEALRYEKRRVTCKGCENSCEVMVLSYPERAQRPGVSARFFTGNKCERIYSNRPKGERRGENLAAVKQQLLLDRAVQGAGTEEERSGADDAHGSASAAPSRPSHQGRQRLRVGIPRALNIWEDFPFWHTLFTEAGCEVVLSDPSTTTLAEKGYNSVMSENICFPAKITNGHIMNLIEKGVDRIFYPKVRYNRSEYTNVINKFNCPVVTGYPQVIESSIDPENRWGIPFDAPPISFHEPVLLRINCIGYLRSLGVDRRRASRAVTAGMRAYEEYRRELRKKSLEVQQRAAEEGRILILLLGRPYHLDPLVNMKIPDIISDLGYDVITEDSLPLPPKKKLPKVQVLTQWAFPNRMFYAAHWAGRHKHVEVVQLNSFGCGPDALTVDEIRSILNQYGKNPTVIKIDEMTSPGSVRLRLRSLMESIRQRRPAHQHRVSELLPRLETRIFTSKDKKKTVLAPQFSPFYTDFLIAAYRHQGYNIEILPMGDRESIELGLRYSNNDICYPATIVIGDLLKALRSGRYDLSQVAVGLTQTGGQCRASSYVSLLKRALIKAGYDNIPVVTASTKSRGLKALNEQPGFRVRTLPFTLTALYGLLFGDVMAKLYYYASVREVEKGSAMRLVRTYIDRGKDIIDHRSRAKMLSLIRQAVEEFNQLPMVMRDAPRVGIVGEIYVKFNPFGNLYTTDWLISHGIQPEVPPLIDFFLIPLISTPYNAANNIEKVKSFVIRLISRAEGYMDRLFLQVNDLLRGFKGDITMFHPIGSMARSASGVIDLINQYGETWLLAGDIAMFAKEGVDNVVCLQPFGCIANHVIAKGVERRMKTLFPSLNLLFLDMDSGMSEVNVLNRMELLVDGLKQRPEYLT